MTNVKPHTYVPDYQLMGDCKICGHEMNDPLHSVKELNPVNCPHGIAMDIYCEQCERFNPPMSAEQLLNKRNVSKLEDASKRISVYEKEIWNAAIDECTAIVSNEIRISAHNKGLMLYLMMKLKK